MKRILIACSTVDGHTVEIGRRLQEQLAALGHTPELVQLEQTPSLPLADYDQIVIGASIRYGHFRPALYQFVERNAALLASKPSAFYAVNAVARKPHKRGAQSNPYVRKFLQQVAWQPQHVVALAGRIDYPRYGWLDRQMIRCIMWLTKGPTDVRRCTEFTDWNQVKALAQTIAAMRQGA